MQATEPVSTVTLRTVRLGAEEQFEAALKDFFQRSKEFPGQLAVHVVRPEPGSDSRQWGILRSFRDASARDEFFNSNLFLEWQAQAAPLMEGDRQFESLCGLEAWFTLPGSRAIIPPPRWKMVVMSTLGGLCSGLLVQRVLGATLALLPGGVKNLGSSLAVATLMTYVFMPWLTRLFRAWLYPPPAAVSR